MPRRRTHSRSGCCIESKYANLREYFYQTKRLLKEADWLFLKETDEPQIFMANFVGPKETPYEGKIIKVEIYLPLQFPRREPIIHFRSKIVHPNVDPMGHIDPTFRKKWNGRLIGLTIALFEIRNLLVFSSASSFDD